MISGDDFRRPRLRRFPESNRQLRLGSYLRGEPDGIVFKAQVRGRPDEALAVKINCRPPRRGYLGVEYWAFERECINRAILDMIAASLRQAAAAGRQIYVHPRPTTYLQARNNLRAFSDEAVTRPQPAEDFVPVEEAHVTGCLGWTMLLGRDLNAHFRGWGREPRVDNERYPAIVYRFVPYPTEEEHIPEKMIDTIVSQLDFFHITGFKSVLFNADNWRGKGMLVDFSAIVSYHTGQRWWKEADYAVEHKRFRPSVTRAADRGLLLARPPPPKPIVQRHRRPPPPPDRSYLQEDHELVQREEDGGESDQEEDKDESDQEEDKGESDQAGSVVDDDDGPV
ncbi:hypothetical protein QBC46DRAFT_313928 [Diplogelasinospora grovesii]|uniref:Uncharacterized protein n=1 Tax=Diplogelasinospora grovesii TaxID=303347 RepID=A0AAN6N856_9PEZI|nr:hypothetical protein QBC46DRAFT_313928 [Diplogelasinospora grovesii]